MTRILAGLAVAAALSACAVGPNFTRPAAPTSGGYLPQALPAATTAALGSQGAGQTFSWGADVPAEWWTLFRSPAIDALVERALKANPDIQSAQAALRAAREAYFAQRAALWPTVDASYNVVREQAGSTLAPPLTSNNDLFTLHTAQLSVSYAPDVFGAVRRQTESVQAQAEAQRFQTEATYLTLTANVVVAAIEAAAFREQLSTTQKTLADARAVLGVMRRQLALGEIARADVAAQEGVVAQAEQAAPPLEKQLAQQQDLLADLTGRFPSESDAAGVDLDTTTLPQALPVSLPSSLVEQRPDVRAAEANLHAASAQVGVAIANRLPNFTLSATAGGASTDIAQLFSNGNGFWSVGGTIAQPIFEGGALLHKERGARAALDQAGAQYKSAVLAAFQNVADSLQALMADARLLQSSDSAERSAAESLAIARRQQALGQVSSLVVMAADQSYQQAHMARIQAAAARLTDTAALYQSLGGGWWNRKETAEVR